jgi:hypothetical protein
MVLSEAEGLLRIAMVDLETAEASSNPTTFREGAWGFWLQQAVEKTLKICGVCCFCSVQRVSALQNWSRWLSSPSMPCSFGMTLIPPLWDWIERNTTKE